MSARSRHDLIFAHEGDARVAASVIMAGMLAVLIGGTVMAIGPQVKQEPRAASNAGTASPAAVRVIGTAPREQAGCDQQVWPNIDQRCLVRTQGNTQPPPATAATNSGTVGSAPANDKVAAAPAKDDDKLSPLTIAPVEHGPAVQNDANSADGIQEDTAVLRSTETTGQALRSETTTRAASADDEWDEAPPPVEKPRRHGHRHHGFHLHFGPFRF